MIELRELIPQVADLLNRTVRQADEPSPERIARFAEKMMEMGYQRHNPHLHDELAKFAASLRGEPLQGKGMFIKGSRGTGKTFGVETLGAIFKFPVMAAKIIEAVFLKANELQFIRFIEGRDFFDRPGIIAIDDVGTESMPMFKFGTPYNLVADILDIRYRLYCRTGIPTLVTTNLNDQELQERYGLRIDDRLNEMMRFITVTGNSLRG